MTEEDLENNANYKGNIVGQQYNLTSDHIIVAGTPLENKGINHEYKSILRDYQGNLGTDVIGLGYININTTADTEDNLAGLKGVFPFKKDYLIQMPSDRKFCDCDNKVEETNEEEEEELIVPEVKGEEEEIPQIIKNFLNSFQKATSKLIKQLSKN